MTTPENTIQAPTEEPMAVAVAAPAPPQDAMPSESAQQPEAGPNAEAAAPAPPAEEVVEEEGECDCRECRIRRDPSEYYTEEREGVYYNYDAYDDGGWGCDWNESGYFD
jgi:hypothetical protein